MPGQEARPGCGWAPAVRAWPMSDVGVLTLRPGTLGTWVSIRCRRRKHTPDEACAPAITGPRSAGPGCPAAARAVTPGSRLLSGRLR